MGGQWVGNSCEGMRQGGLQKPLLLILLFVIAQNVDAKGHGEVVGPMVDPNLSRRNFFLYLFTGINRPRHPRRPRNMDEIEFFTRALRGSKQQDLLREDGRVLVK